MDATWIAIIVTIVIAVVVGFIATRERIAKVETDVETLKTEQTKTREHMHKLRDDLPKIVRDFVDLFSREKK